MKGRGQIIFLICVLGVLTLLYFIYNNNERHYQWFENYRAGSDQPYGTLFIQKMLAGYRPGVGLTLNDKKPISKLLKEVKEPAHTDYILVGANILLDEQSVKALAEFMNAGGNAFIATLTPPVEIVRAVYFPECGADIEYQLNRQSSVTLNFFHHALRDRDGFSYAFRYGNIDEPYSWNYINNPVFCDSTRSIIPLGYQLEDHVNFIKIRAGKGNLFLHSNPLVFTNYFLTMPEKMSYASAVFSHLNGSHIIWDEYSKIMFTGNDNAYNSPLYYILQQPSLKYAWWLLLLTVALYILFAARRQQRVIPVLEAKTNTSLEFINLISRLHYKNGNHVDMARKKMKYFLYFVRSKYGIHAERFRDQEIHRLAGKSRVSLADVRGIFSQYNLIEEKFRDNIEANRLVDLYDAIENFYRQCNKDHTEHGRNHRGSSSAKG